MKTLNRAEFGRPAAPVRIVHLGIGNFTRAHQVWYTDHAGDAAQWGIAGFTGRSAEVAEQLAPQEGLYQLAIQHPEGDQVEVISALSTAHPASDLDAWVNYFKDPRLAIVTSTVTEAGYCRAKDGNLDFSNPDVKADLDALKANPEDTNIKTAPAKFVLGLLVRRAAGAGPLTFCPCDNIPHNGAMVETVTTQAAEYVDPELKAWMDENVSFVTTMVDRITPRATDEDKERVSKLTGVSDPALVVTEPFSEWVLAGEFKNGRPQWETMGAQFVEDIDPSEDRKLFLLNGSHSLMAYSGSVLGYETIFDAIQDPTILGWVNAWWDEAVTVIDLPAQELADYRAALLDRYLNPKIKHLLKQIAMDGSQKVPIRTVPTLKAVAARGEEPVGAARTVAAWVLNLRGEGAPVNDPFKDELLALVTGDLADSVTKVLEYIGVQDDKISALVTKSAQEILDLKAAK